MKADRETTAAATAIAKHAEMSPSAGHTMGIIQIKSEDNIIRQQTASVSTDSNSEGEGEGGRRGRGAERKG